ncbi:hypothetical protein OH686_08760 [Pseudomonas sp. SO81]|nr:hypothetical protein OH686_08760 [Pseudomonas sp. SO81]
MALYYEPRTPDQFPHFGSPTSQGMSPSCCIQHRRLLQNHHG